MEELLLFPEEEVGEEEGGEVEEGHEKERKKERRVKPKMRIVIVHHDRMRVNVDEKYYEVPIFDRYIDMTEWVDEVRMVIRKGPEYVEKVGKEVPVEEMSKDIEWAKRGSYRRILEELDIYIPEFKGYLYPKVQPRKL
jgi:hypothetical protein